MSSHAGISAGRSVSSASARDHAELLLAGERLLAEAVPALVELALVLVGPLLRHVVRRVGGAGGEVDEERLVGHQRLLLAHPVDGLIGHVLGEVVALLGRPLGLDRHRVAVDRRRPLVRLAADEAVEVLEPGSGRPLRERAHRARLPHRHLVALAELRRRVAVQLQRLGQRGGRVGADRVVARRRGGDLGDAAHADGVVVAAGQQRLAGRRAQRRGVEAVEAQAAGGESLGRRAADRAAERARGGEADVVDEHDQHVRRAARWPQRLDRRERRRRVLRVVGHQPGVRLVGDRQHVPTQLIAVARHEGLLVGVARRGWDGGTRAARRVDTRCEVVRLTPRLVIARRPGRRSARRGAWRALRGGCPQRGQRRPSPRRAVSALRGATSRRRGDPGHDVRRQPRLPVAGQPREPTADHGPQPSAATRKPMLPAVESGVLALRADTR